MKTYIAFREFNNAQIRLIQAAERLFAAKGLDAVSDREIAREAGQKNNSAVQYHFQDRESLLQAILDFRLLPINAFRSQMLANLKTSNQTADIKQLVSALLMPYVQHMLLKAEPCFHMNVLSQLYSRHAENVIELNEARHSSMLMLEEYLHQALTVMSLETIRLKLQWSQRLLVFTIADWEQQRAIDCQHWTSERIHQYSDDLTSYIVGGMLAPLKNS